MWKWIIFCLMFSAHLSAELKVLAFAGSSREGSVNKKLVIEAADLARRKNVDVTVIDFKDHPIPLYEEELETKQGMPESVKKLRKLMIQSDIIFIASPEYNGSLSGMLKNAIDWASRSETGTPSRDAFKGKKFVIMSASPGPGGGARGLVHLRTILENLGGIVVPGEVVVPDAYQAFDEQGHLKNSKVKSQLEQLVEQAIKG